MPTNASQKSWTVCTEFAPSVSSRSWTLLKERDSSCAPFADIRHQSQIRRCRPCLTTPTSCPAWPCRSPGALTILERCSWLQRVSPPPAHLQTPPAAWSSLWQRSSGTRSTPPDKTLPSIPSRAWSPYRWAPTGTSTSTPRQSSAITSHAPLCGCWVSCILAHCLWESICWCYRKWHWALWVLAWCPRASPSAWSMSSAVFVWGRAWPLLQGLTAYWSRPWCVSSSPRWRVARVVLGLVCVSSPCCVLRMTVTDCNNKKEAELTAQQSPGPSPRSPKTLTSFFLRYSGSHLGWIHLLSLIYLY